MVWVVDGFSSSIVPEECFPIDLARPPYNLSRGRTIGSLINAEPAWFNSVGAVDHLTFDPPIESAFCNL